MTSKSRRRFLQQASTAGAALATGRWLGGAAQARPELSPTRIYVDPARKIAPLDRNLLGSFLEHLGRAIYGGVYEPGSKLADSSGFRKDVLEEIRQLGVPIIRYPGGNFVSGYNWLDGVGPRDKRPRVLEKAWNSIETNQFGVNDFVTWCRAVGAEPLLGLNFGTGTAEMAATLVEYCNQEKGTKWSDLRRQHGFEKPHHIKHWCLGNEMDGPWQIGHLPAREYGLKVRDAALQMRAVDPSIQLVACGSSGPGMPTYLEWDRQTLEECYDQVDALSLHCYYGNDKNDSRTGGDSRKFVAMNLAMDKQIEEIAAVCDYVRGRKRSAKRLWLSFDEWNVWYRARSGDGGRQEAPHLLEEIYNLEDALLVGGLLNSLLRHADRVHIACLAQLVNVIAPIMTDPDGLFRQTIYYPYAWALQCARGDVLNLMTESATYGGQDLGPVPYLDVAGTTDPAGKTLSLFILNRDLDKSREVEVVWREAPPPRVVVSQVLTGQDLKASNSFENPRRVAPQSLDAPKAATRTTFQLPARSYSVIQWGP
ncbi:MAG: alpha-L-arabinofuranosidase C-terminal domain-containing protein [Terriglobia bacterium]